MPHSLLDRADRPAPNALFDAGFLHIHFGSGRLGLGLVAPFFRTARSELYLLNRAVSGERATEDAAVTAARRNALLAGDADRSYLIQRPDAPPCDGEIVTYDGFHDYDGASIEDVVRAIARSSTTRAAGVVVTASIVNLAAYASVVRALNTLSAIAAEEDGATGPIFLVACENTLGAAAVLADSRMDALITPQTRARVIPVPSMVDRICTALDEVRCGERPTLLVAAEDYGSLLLELSPATEALQGLCCGNRVAFSRHVETEKQIKGWLLNGAHSLIALNAFQASEGDRALKLNEYLGASAEHRAFAAAVMEELCEGIGLVLRSDPAYAAFVADTDVDSYLAERAQAMLARFIHTEDSISRILARFQAPMAGANLVEAFARRFTDRINPPMEAYEAENGAPPPAASQAVFSLLALVASGKFVNAALDVSSPLLPRAEAELALNAEAAQDDLAVQTYVMNDAAPIRVRPGSGSADARYPARCDEGTGHEH